MPRLAQSPVLTRTLLALAATLATLAPLASIALAQPPADAPPAPPAPTATPTPTTPTPPRERPARPDRRIDAETGRDKQNWPPHPYFTYHHMKLDMVIRDMEVKQFSALQTLDLAPIGKPRRNLSLVCRPTITIESIQVQIPGQQPVAAKFEHAGNWLEIDLGRDVPVGQPVQVITRYSAKNPAGDDGVGLNWFASRPATENRSARDAQIHSQGQAEWNSYWFPCHDFPNLRLTTEIAISVPDGFSVVSNGKLLSSQPDPANTSPDGKPLVRWHWLQDKPHPNYLVMLAVGKFDIINVGGPDTARPGLDMPVYGPPGSAAALKDIYKNTPEMVALYEKLFDEPYPWDKYAQVIVYNFRWGGMENTSATVLGEFAAAGSPGRHDDLIAHELAHQWTGDLLTCKSWEHLWLNEGWATYAEWLWVEHKRGDEAYLGDVRAAIAAQSRANRTLAPRDPAMASRFYANPDEPFTKPNDVYGKGGLVIHMLRERLGDEAFWKGVRAYIKRHKFGHVETDDFRKALEEASGESLERFFWQWVKRPGLPRLAVKINWNPADNGNGGSLDVAIDQTQPIDADNPAYAFEVPVWVEFSDAEGDAQFVRVPIETKSASKSFALAKTPIKVTVDPRLTVTAPKRVETNLGGAKPAEPKPADKPEGAAKDGDDSK